MGFSVGGLVDKARKVGGSIVSKGAPWGAAYDVYRATQGGGGGGYQMSAEQLAKRAQDRIALSKLTGGVGVNLDKANQRVAAAGLPSGGGDAYAYLAKLASKGGVAGKKAAYYTQLIAMNNVGEAAKTAAATGASDIATAYNTMGEQFAGTLGAGVDVNSPALLDAVRRYTEGRSSDTQRLLTNLKGQETSAKNAILLGQIAPTLDSTGALVESLDMLKQEQASLRNAQYTNLGMNAIGMGLKAFGVGGYGLPTVVNQA